MSINGYSDKLIEIDDEMLTLDRPRAPFTSWLRTDSRKDPRSAHKAWLEAVEAWEESNPEKAIRWQELMVAYAAQREVEKRATFDGSEDAWGYVLLADIGVPGPYLDTIQGKFHDNASMRSANAWLRDGTQWSLTLIGGTGCGKSTAATWAAHQLYMRRFRPVWVDCVKQCELPMYGVAAEHTRWRCREAAVLVLDDLGSGAREQKSDLWHAWLDDIVGSRANAAKKTIITTNRSQAELRVWLGARLVDRLNAGTITSTGEASMRGQK